MKDVGGWDLLCNEDCNEDCEYLFFQVYKKCMDGKYFYLYWELKLVKCVVVLCYGVFGDVIQVFSILLGLKVQGFYVIFYCMLKMQDVLCYDLYIDVWYVQDVD